MDCRHCPHSSPRHRVVARGGERLWLGPFALQLLYYEATTGNILLGAFASVKLRVLRGSRFTEAPILL